MLLYIIPTIIIFVCVVAMAVIVFQHRANLVIINVESIPKEKEAKVKNRIMLERLTRNFTTMQKTIQTVSKPIVTELSTQINKLYQKALELEQKSIEQQPLKKIDIDQQIKETLEKVNTRITEKNYAAAEEECINVVRLDSKNIDVYELMVDIYLAQREFKKARETARFLLKLLQKRSGDGDKHRLAKCYYDLGWIYQLERRNTFALTNYQKAVELEPNNPRFLDLLLKMSIIVKNKNLAEQVFNSLQQADPGNQKLSELAAEIAALPAADSGEAPPVA